MCDVCPPNLSHPSSSARHTGSFCTPAEAIGTVCGWSLAFECVFSAFYWCMTYVMQVFWFVTGVTPLVMLYKKTVTFFSGGLQNDPV